MTAAAEHDDLRTDFDSPAFRDVREKSSRHLIRDVTDAVTHVAEQMRVRRGGGFVPRRLGTGHIHFEDRPEFAQTREAAMDGRIADGRLAPPGFDENVVDRLVRRRHRFDDPAGEDWTA